MHLLRDEHVAAYSERSLIIATRPLPMRCDHVVLQEMVPHVIEMCTTINPHSQQIILAQRKDLRHYGFILLQVHS